MTKDKGRSHTLLWIVVLCVAWGIVDHNRQNERLDAMEERLAQTRLHVNDLIEKVFPEDDMKPPMMELFKEGATTAEMKLTAAQLQDLWLAGWVEPLNLEGQSYNEPDEKGWATVRWRSTQR